ncbi:MAG: hypothetical protein J6M02_04335 [Clostridia bacterium]|nr:hypothetical protein [Clostridia bacterium]
MSEVYNKLQDRFGMGRESLEILQEKAQRIAVLSGFVAEKVAEKQALMMSENEISDAALVTRTVHPENEGIYNGKEPFDPAKNKQRGDYSLRIAEERGVELTEAQKAVVLGKENSMESRIIKLAETVIAVQYHRVQRGVEKEAMTEPGDIMAELLADDRIDGELVRDILGEQELTTIIASERNAFAPEKENAKDEVPRVARNSGMDR